MPIRAHHDLWQRVRPYSRLSWTLAIGSGFGFLYLLGVAKNVFSPKGYGPFGWPSFGFLVYPVHLLVVPLGFAVVAGILRWQRFRLATLFVTGAAFLTLLLCIVPLAGQWRQASDLGVSVSISGLLKPGQPDGEETDPVTFTATDGFEIVAHRWEAESPASGPRPVVLLLHGGGWGMNGPGEFPNWNRLLAERGFAVFDLEYRMPKLDPPSFTPELQVGDVKCVVGSIRAQAAELGVDPARITLMGQSAGAHVAMLAAYTVGDPALPPSCEVEDQAVQSVVSLYGLPDLAEAWADSRSPTYGRQTVIDYIGGTPQEIPGRYRELSPITHVGPDSPSTLSIIGKSDRLVPPAGVRALGVALEDAGVAHDEWYLAFADHAFDVNWGAPPTRIARVKVLEFLDAPG